ncbi:MAG: TIGR04282 family arsenosugar biosynthesis glycosyltransferase [Porticoccaceae bacterium]|nr:TIGR04282 family arsenosugar biosynthesis glycosyltransferase [Porticoccaceae bacterium]
MNYEFPEALLIQFAKAPQLGQVKTRMQPVLSTEQSLALHCQLVLRTHQTLHREGLCYSQLWISGVDDGGFFQSLDPLPEIKQQEGDDLGERMHTAITAGLGKKSAVVLIGSDCPAINGNYLRTALFALKKVDVVIGPAADGGYVLIGMKKAEQKIFADVDWSTPRVLQQTYARLQASKLSYFELPVLNDIDRPEDLVYLDLSPILQQ